MSAPLRAKKFPNRVDDAYSGEDAFLGLWRKRKRTERARALAHMTRKWPAFSGELIKLNHVRDARLPHKSGPQ
jgi:hypothetical protein